MKIDYRADLTLSQKRTTTMIVNALFTLMMKKDLDSITVGEICTLSMIPRSTFYTYFEDKYDIVRWKVYKEFYTYYPEIDIVMDHYDNIDKAADAMYVFIEKNRTILTKVASKNPIDGSFFKVVKETVDDLATTLKNNCTRSKNFAIPYEIVFNNYKNGFIEIFYQSFYKKQNYSSEQIRNYMREYYAK